MSLLTLAGISDHASHLHVIAQQLILSSSTNLQPRGLPILPDTDCPAPGVPSGTEVLTSRCEKPHVPACGVYTAGIMHAGGASVFYGQRLVF